MSPTARRLLWRWAPLVPIAAVLVWHSLQFDFVTDDAYISFVYSRNLAEHGQLAFNLGHPVEGYTNFLWTVILAGGMVLGVPPEIASRVLGTGFGVATLVVVFRLTERLVDPAASRPGAEPRCPACGWAYLPPALLACSSGFACWSSGGLETQLFTFLVAFAIDGYVAADQPGGERRLPRVGVALALAAMTRPEGLLITALIVAHRLGLNMARDRRWLPRAVDWLTLGSFLTLWAPWFAWRWAYYGWPFPNTYYVKAAGHTTARYDHELHQAGLYYVEQWLRQTRLLWASPVAVLGLLWARPRQPRFAFTSLAALILPVYLAYVVSVGGDFMGLHRFIMPLFVLAAIAVVLGLERLASLLHPAQLRPFAAATVAAIVLGLFAWTQARLTHASLHPAPGKFADHGIDTPAYLIAYTENRAAIGRAMAGCFTDDDFSIVGGAGAQPYLGHMRGIDVFGLVSERIAHEVAPGRPRPGHNKWGPDPLLAEHDPDFVFHCYAIHSKPTIAPLGCGAFWRAPARGFEQRTIEVPGLVGEREGRDDDGGPGPAKYYTFLVKRDRAFACPGLVP
ncbi:MAG: hypothetical protein H6708_11765 [Kofleriaceae bacterium]|nr:hypothetical protein [Myxococcales bacterium]MCB9561076.1 hypothetical protein [Kofleriaceae bacterium]